MDEHPLLTQLKQYCDAESEANMGHAVLEILWPVIKAAEQVEAQFGKFHGVSMDRLKLALADLESKLK